ncbi:hypothetical protein AALB39_06315, partial [Lachnospiraceae bacterium 54-53]
SSNLIDGRIPFLKSRWNDALFWSTYIPTSDFAQTMMKVLLNSFGLDKAGLFKETTFYGYGWERQGSAIKEKLESAFASLQRSNRILVASDGKINLGK